MKYNSVRPKKFLGQHFLTDLSIASRIADTVDACPGLPVLEVGPGMGVMTQFLVRKPRELKVVEIDDESVTYLRRNFPELEESIIEDDFLKMHLERTFGGRPFVLTGNYPYNISSQIFFRMLDYKELIPCCTGMIQKEVAERMAAGPGSKTYGILSVLVQAWYDVEYLFTVEPGVFNPPERRHPPDAQLDNFAGLRREALPPACQDDVQPAAQDAAQQYPSLALAAHCRAGCTTLFRTAPCRPRHAEATRTARHRGLHCPDPKAGTRPMNPQSTRLLP